MSFKNKIVMVTGGAGFIGSHICDKALEEGAEKVICADNFIANTEKNIQHLKNNERFEFEFGDVADSDFITPLVKKSDVIFHEAASKFITCLKTPRVDLNTNIVGTFNILEAAKDTGTRIVYASTGSVFGSAESPKHSMKEDYIKNPTSMYGISKLTGEHYVLYYAKEFGIKATSLRYFHVYGPRQDFTGEAGVVSIFLSKVLSGKEPIIYGTGEQIRCFTYIQDDIDANLLLYKNNKTIGKAYNVASTNRITINQLAELIVKKYGENLKPIFGPARKGENMWPIPDTSKIEKLGFKAKVSFEEGLHLTKKWVEGELKRIKGQ
tara:strand:+ start:9910 stop:10878 length:969 start_codon:yes stop_codon:yes gene_type:complete